MGHASFHFRLNHTNPQPRGIAFEQYLKLPVSYKDQLIGNYEADFVIEGQIIIELKAVSAISAAHEAQAHHYLATTGLKLAVILNPSINSGQALGPSPCNRNALFAKSPPRISRSQTGSHELHELGEWKCKRIR